MSRKINTFIGNQRHDKRAHACFLAVWLILFSGITSAAAGVLRDVSPSTGFDTVPGTQIPNQCIGLPCATIQNAVNWSNPGDTIRILDDVVNECGITINTNITLLGYSKNQVTLDAQNSCPHFNIGSISSTTVSMQALRLINGSSTTSGGSISVFPGSNLTLNAAMMLDNNSATVNGGAINNLGTVTINRGTLIIDNFASGNGGAINNLSGTVVINGASTVSNNSASLSGGAVFNTGGTVLVNQYAMLDENTAARGGAIFNTLGGRVDINPGSFLRSNTARDGGAIANFSTLNITGAQLSENESTLFGGAIASFSGTVTIKDSTLRHNTAFSDGGAIFNISANLEVSDDSKLLFNSTSNGSGGAIANYEGGVLTLIGSTLSENNSMLFGGGIVNVNAGANVNVRTSTLINNNTSGSGGAVANLHSATFTTSDSTYTDNVADENGGALFDDADNSRRTVIRRSTFDVNSAELGGAIYYSGAIGGEFLMNNSTLSGNIASAQPGGAGIFNTGSGFFHMANTTLYGQIVEVGLMGSAVWTDSTEKLQMDNSIISNTHRILTTGVIEAGSDCATGNGSFISGFHNFSETCGTIGAGGPSNNLGAVVGLDSQLKFNGGDTATHALLDENSNAIDVGFNDCPDPAFGGNSLQIDQRGENRKVDGDLDTIAVCDVGSFEYIPQP